MSLVIIRYFFPIKFLETRIAQVNFRTKKTDFKHLMEVFLNETRNDVLHSRDPSECAEVFIDCLVADGL